MSFHISPSPRVRPSPFHAATVADGVRSFTVYNHMLMPTGFGDPTAEYERLTTGVSMWDVSVERQVEFVGPDAGRLAQVLCPRKLDRLRPGVGWYVPMCDHRGVVMNDPVLLMLAEDRYWLSIADSDVMWWARAVAAERGFDVRVFEPDVSPLAVQGPRAEDVVAALLGEEVRTIRHFRFREMMLDDIPLVVARSGYSKQGGFELYLCDGTKGTALWDRVKAAGAPFGIGPGNPNNAERIESGLLSWGGDTDDDANPFELRMERYIDLDAPDDVIGIQALREIHARGAVRHQLGVFVDMPGKLDFIDQHSDVFVGERHVGRITAHSWSPRLERNVGIALLSRDVVAGDTVSVLLPTGDSYVGTTTALPFI